MILELADIQQIITERPHKALLTAAQEYTKKLLMHVKGVKLDQYIERITAFERADVTAIRKKYAVSNKGMFARINRPTDKVYSAKGGSVMYADNDTQAKKMQAYMKNVVDGFTLKQWLKTYWMPAMSYDPMGVILMEMTADGKPYPTYKSVLDIFEYKLKGRNLDYIIFKLPTKQMDLGTNQMNSEPNPQRQPDQHLTDAVAAGHGTAAELYRVIDDTTDRIVKLSGTSIIEVQEETYPNYWMEVPGSIISNIYDPVLSMYVSTEDQIIDLADQFLREGSVVNVVKNYHGYPKAWQYASDCPECAGTGELNGSKCSYCKGTRVKSQTHPEETIQVPVPLSTDQPKIAPDLAGYVTPPIEGINMLMDQLKHLENMMFQTKWGTQMEDAAKGGEKETATGKFIDIQPVNDKLNEYSDAAEMMETFITDKIGQILIGQSYKGASVSYGRRFMMETPDMLWKKVTDSIISGAPEAALYDLYDDYLQARYSSNAMELARMQKLARVEPLPWVKFSDFGRLQTFPDIMLRRKAWFGDWVCSKEATEILFATVQELRADFEQFCKDMDTDLNTQVQENPAINAVATPPTDPAVPGKTPAKAAA
jgi:hypothetical protein